MSHSTALPGSEAPARRSLAQLLRSAMQVSTRTSAPAGVGTAEGAALQTLQQPVEIQMFAPHLVQHLARLGDSHSVVVRAALDASAALVRTWAPATAYETWRAELTALSQSFGVKDFQMEPLAS